MKFFKYTRLLLGGIALSCSVLSADNIISTAAGGAFPNGYFGELVSTSTTVIRGTVICKQGINIGANKLFYDADGPVYGRIQFNTGGTQGGALVLGSDLRLGSTCELRSAGNDLKMTVSGCADWSGGISNTGNALVLGDDLRLTFTTWFSDSTVIDGRGHTLTLQAPLEVDDYVTLTLKNMRLVVSPGVYQPFVALGASAGGGFDFENVEICLPPDQITFVRGEAALTCTRNVRVFGPGSTFRLCFNESGLTGGPGVYISAQSALQIGQDVTLSMWGDSPNIFPTIRLFGNDLTSELLLNGCTLDIGSGTSLGGLTYNALSLSNMTVYFDNKVTVSVTMGGSVVTTPDVDGYFSIDLSTANARVRGGATLNANGPMMC